MTLSTTTLWIAGLALLNALALLAAAGLAFSRERSPRARRRGEIDRADAAPKPQGTETDGALRELVGEVERIEAARTAGPRGEARLAAEIGRWRARANHGREWPRAADPCRPRGGADAPARQG